MNLTGWPESLDVTADGEGIVSHAGLTALPGVQESVPLFTRRAIQGIVRRGRSRSWPSGRRRCGSPVPG